MNKFDWIMSEGGPLICVEAALAASWGGIDRLSIFKPGAVTDYDRACEGRSKALTSAPLQRGGALFFQGPFDTSFWQRASDGKIYVVRVEACEVGLDFYNIMENMDNTVFSDPIEELDFSFTHPELVMFDSAESGKDLDRKIINFQIEPARYNILSKFVETDQYSLLLHRFDMLE